jgi:curved DNA-binding protein CbpA
MKIKYFVRPYGIKSLRKQYFDLSKRLHPDKGGSDEAFVEMKKEYEFLIENWKFLIPQNARHVKKVKPIKKKNTFAKNIIINIDIHGVAKHELEDLFNDVFEKLKKKFL